MPKKMKTVTATKTKSKVGMVVSILVLTIICTTAFALAKVLYNAALPLTTTCTDTDGGNNIYLKGTVSGGKYGVVGYNHTPFTDYCNPYKPNDLIEYFCIGDIVQFNINQCPNGCKDGACINEIFCSADSVCTSGGRSCKSMSTGKEIFAPAGYSCFERVDSTPTQPVIVHNAIIKKSPKTLPYKLLIVPLAIEGTTLNKGVQCCSKEKDFAGNNIYVLKYCASGSPANLIRYSFLDTLKGGTLACFNDGQPGSAHGISYLKNYWEGEAQKYGVTYPITISVSNVKYFPKETHPEKFSVADQLDWYASFVDMNKVDIEFDGVIIYLLGNDYYDYGNPDKMENGWIGFNASAHPYISKDGKAFRFFAARWLLSGDFQADAFDKVGASIHEFGHYLGATDLYQYISPYGCKIPEGVPSPSSFPQTKACDMCSKLMISETTSAPKLILEHDFVLCNQSAIEIGWKK